MLSKTEHKTDAIYHKTSENHRKNCAIEMQIQSKLMQNYKLIFTRTLTVKPVSFTKNDIGRIKAVIVIIQISTMVTNA
jgi:hypothetical protein